MKSRYGFRVAITFLFLSAAATRVAGQDGSSPSERKNKSDTSTSGTSRRKGDGHPDLSGFWDNGGPPIDNATVKHSDHVEIRFGDNTPTHKVSIARRKADPNQPPYKPELLAKVRELDENEIEFDPVVSCRPAGIPRMGAPSAIIQAPKLPIVFLYETVSGNEFRLIPTDGRPHDPDADPSYMGDSVGHWEGNTLVVDAVNFTDDSWLGIDGWFHSTAMHVIERLSREGDTLHYQATVEDPNVFTRPWVMNPRTSKWTAQLIVETPPCMDKDAQHIVTKDHD